MRDPRQPLADALRRIGRTFKPEQTRGHVGALRLSDGVSIVATHGSSRQDLNKAFDHHGAIIAIGEGAIALLAKALTGDLTPKDPAELHQEALIGMKTPDGGVEVLEGHSDETPIYLRDREGRVIALSLEAAVALHANLAVAIAFAECGPAPEYGSPG